VRAIGPLECVVLTFPGAISAESLSTVLRGVEMGGDVRLVDALLAWRRSDHRLVAVPPTAIPELASVAAAFGLGACGPGLLGSPELGEAARVLSSGLALVLLVEHVWAQETAEAARTVGGRLVAASRLTAERAAAVAARMAQLRPAAYRAEPPLSTVG